MTPAIQSGMVIYAKDEEATAAIEALKNVRIGDDGARIRYGYVRHVPFPCNPSTCIRVDRANIGVINKPTHREHNPHTTHTRAHAHSVIARGSG